MAYRLFPQMLPIIAIFLSVGTVSNAERLGSVMLFRDMRRCDTVMGAPGYFANGDCTLMALRCIGDALICSSAALGDCDAMPRCPVGSALVRTSGVVDVMGLHAELDSPLCAPLCNSEGDCRGNETDPVMGEAPAGYTCHTQDGARFCYAPRNLAADTTATGK